MKNSELFQTDRKIPSILINKDSVIKILSLTLKLILLETSQKIGSTGNQWR